MGVAPNSAVVSVNDLAYILAISTKYDAPDLRRKAIQELEKRFPTTLDAYDTRSIVPTKASLVPALKLFRDCDAVELLPSLFYMLTEGALDDGKFQELSALPRHEIQRCIIGRENLLKSQKDLTWACVFLPTVSRRCRDRLTCKCAAFQISQKAYSNDLHMRQYALDNAVTMFPYWHLYCTACRDELQNAVVSSRRKVWDDLPGYFGLGTWTRLRATQEQA